VHGFLEDWKTYLLHPMKKIQPCLCLVYHTTLNHSLSKKIGKLGSKDMLSAAINKK
jgi:hypothetical protein